MGMKKIRIHLLLIIILSISFTFIFITNIKANEIKKYYELFEDPVFAEWIANENEKKATEPVTQSDLDKKKKLDVFSKDKPIYSLKGIENCKNIRELSLSGTKIKNLPEKLKELSMLKTITLDENPLTEGMEDVVKILQLEKITIRNCKMAIIPESIEKMTYLEVLCVYDNEIFEIPAGLTKVKKLKKLELVNTNLDKLPKAIGNFKNLEYLYLKDNKIEEIPNEIKDIKSLEIIDIGDNRISNIDSLIEMQNLKWINADRNHIKYINFDSLSKKEGFTKKRHGKVGFEIDDKCKLKLSIKENPIAFSNRLEIFFLKTKGILKLEFYAFP